MSDLQTNGGNCLEAIQALRNELRAERIKSNVAILGAVISLSVSIIFLIQARSLLAPASPSTSGGASLSREATTNSSPTFQTVTANSIAITNSSGKEVASIDDDGIYFFNGTSATLTLNNAQTGYTKIGAGFAVMDEYPNTPGSEEMTLSYLGMILSNTATKGDEAQYTLEGVDVDNTINSIALGSLYGGLYIYSDHFDKDNSNGQPVDKSSASFTINQISLLDNEGTERVSIGQTSLTTPSTGATQTTGLSSVVLFDTSGHVSWQTP